MSWEGPDPHRDEDLSLEREEPDSDKQHDWERDTEALDAAYEAELAHHDDDPNPYHGTYSEE